MVYNRDRKRKKQSQKDPPADRTESVERKEGINMAALHFTKDNFEKEVLQSDVPVLVDFWATWCGPCQMVLPIIEELSEELTGVKIGKGHVDEEMELAKQYRVMSIPTLIVFKDGKKVNMAVGAQGKEEIKALLGL